MSRLHWLPLVVLCVALKAGCAAPAVQVDERGIASLRGAGGEILFADAQIRIVHPKWQGFAGQENATGMQREQTGGKEIIRGHLQSALVSASFEQTVTTESDGTRLDYVLRMEKAFTCEGIVWNCRVPVNVAKDGRYRVGNVAGALPQTLPQPYIFASGEAGTFGWAKGDTGFAASIPQDVRPRIALQDDRQFKMSDYEFQATVMPGGTTKPGDTVQFSILLSPATETTLRQLKEPRDPSTQPELSMRGSLAITAVRRREAPVRRYDRIEFDLDLSATYENPFDPRQIDVSGDFIAPDGSHLTVPAFLWADYRRELTGGRERLRLAGSPQWKLRFCPVQTGKYSVTVHARDRSGTVASAPVSFTVEPGTGTGFVRRSKQDSRYFRFDNGKPYFAIGANVCWGGGRGTFNYDTWLPKYGDNGANYFRVWLAPAWNTFAIEQPGDGSDGCGCGWIDLANAWRLEYVLNLAEQHGEHVMLCIDSFNELRKQVDGAYPFWENTPQNAANGGPLKEPVEFWDNPKMLQLYRNKLRYLVARWGSYTDVLSWEFWNEVDIVSRTAWDTAKVKQWHTEMADYLHSIDPYKHLVTTSFARSTGVPEIDRLPGLDYVQTHSYGQRDIAAAVAHFQQMKVAYQKPHYVGELGTDAGGGEQKVDPTGICLHNGLWSALASGCAGTGMLWWWDSDIDPNNLYYHYGAIAKFVAGIDFPEERFQPVTNATLQWVKTPTVFPRRDIEISQAQGVWQDAPSNRPSTAHVDAVTGKVAVDGEISSVLHGLHNHPTWHNPVTFEIKTDAPVVLNVTVTGVSGYGGAHLIVKLDGATVHDEDMPDTDNKHNTLHQYDGVKPIRIPAGSHTVVVENIGADWLMVGYGIPEAVPMKDPWLRLFGLTGRTTTLIWAQNPQHNWYRVRILKREPAPVPPTTLRVPGLPAGRYQVTVWDTYAGKALSTDEQQVNADGGLAVALPTVDKDVAVKIVRR